MPATIIWNELVTSNQNQSGEFFNKLLGWECTEIHTGQHGTYTLFRKDDVEVAGMMNPVSDYSQNRPPFWIAYIKVDDVDAHVSKVEKLGGKVIASPEDIPNVGRVCMISDPSGAPICLMAPIPSQK